MTSHNSNTKLWAGRFAESTAAEVEAFTASVDVDGRLYAHDIKGSIAHATMLAKVGVLGEDERDAIVAGLESIRDDIDAGRLQFSEALEDVHMNIEAALTERIGVVGKKLHTGRSRNDQVATDVRLYLRDGIDGLIHRVGVLRGALLDLAEPECDTIMPGFTHMQTAQPVTLAHHLMAWHAMLARDSERLAQCRRRINRSPLGAAALAGTSFPIDPHMTAELLGFDSVCPNSLDAVSDRDFMIELGAVCSLIMIHLSRMCEELVMWCSAQFDFVAIGDAYCTGSSIMPQKKNPDVAELIRGKTGGVIGHLTALMVLMKGQPLAYNRDNQEDKRAIFQVLDTTGASLQVFAGMMPSLTFKRERLYESARLGYATATDLADYLVRKGVAFRDAHEVVGNAVRYGIEQGKDLAELGLDELRRFSQQIEDDVYSVLTLEGSVASRNHVGGTAPQQVRKAIAAARQGLVEEGSQSACI